MHGSAASRRTPSAILEYLSPEEALGEKTDTRADLFSLGCVLYEMLTGKAPFDRPTPDATVLAVLRSQPPSPSASMATIPAELDLIATRALAKSLDRRYPTATALAEDLRVAKSVLDADVEERTVFGDEASRPAFAPVGHHRSECSWRLRRWPGGS